ncbi:hypothetical protein [Deinococcus fonticola]|uniref:hypothetical protein n=1 Tax=Deinococcus fonticola TaxID=2528713 RepID=UPI001074D364|nr:hypothetical protein [Deinococcus fonticola]
MAGETEHSPEPTVLRPGSTASELSFLAVHGDAPVRAAVAAHPNTPAELLGQLAAEFPAEVLGNLAWPLLRLAQPNLLKAWPEAAVIALLRLPQAPEWFRHHAAKSDSLELQVALARHPALSPAEIDQLARHSAWVVRARIAARTDVSAELLHTLAHDPDYGVRLALASRSDLPASSVAALRRDPSHFVRQVIEQTQRASLSALLFLLCLWPG